MHRICPHCWHSLDAALRVNPALALCPDCGGDIDAAALNGTRVEEPGEPDTMAEETAAPEPVGTEAAADAVLDETGDGFLHEDAFATETALETIEQEDADEAFDDTAEPLPELEAQAVEGVAESMAESRIVADQSAPSFTRSRAPLLRPRSSRWQWVALVALGPLLGVQILLADRERLASDPGWRPLLGAMCRTLRCELPPWREPEAFAMLSRDVRPLPGAPGTLLVQATFRNDARWPQPWPALQLSLSDADGRVVGARVFTAKEYLDKSITQAGLSPGQSAQVSLRLREPETPTVAFTFEFR